LEQSSITKTNLASVLFAVKETNLKQQISKFHPQIQRTDAIAIIERCNYPWPHVANRHISISQLLSLWRHSHYDICRLRRSRRSQPPFSLWRHSHCDVIRYWTGHAHRYGRTNLRTDTLPHIIYEDVSAISGLS